ncbi:unnamed protein product [Nippostrongylus brasiliensis]|uniref:39S ribosomal protein L33, mitochondrial n=1 Tax=Nippostrongylus brasiliensis TaxID=27835 RepID=A0A0N4YX55_NIPBR|nr:unnamed protein product [Nippostrongylus brasiliensis]
MMMLRVRHGQIFFVSRRRLSLSPIRLKDIDLNDPKQVALHKLYRPERITPKEKGYDLLKNPRLNKVTHGS